MFFLLQILCVLGAGVLAGFAHPFKWHWNPSFSFEPSFWTFLIASIGLLIFMAAGLRPRKPYQRFLLGLFFGIGFFGFVLYWISIALTEFGDIPWSIALLVNLLLVLYCSVYFGIWALLAGSEHLKILNVMARVLAWASLWAALESLRQIVFTGFHWGELGYAFAWVPWLRISASIWGVHGLTFAWIFTLAVLLNIDQISRSRKAVRLIALTYFLFLAVFITSRLDRRITDPATVKIGIVQPNISQDTKWNPAEADHHLERLVDLTKSLTQGKTPEQRPDFIAWPETAFPFLVSSSQKLLPLSSDIPLVVGAVVRDGHVNRNSALLVEKDQIESRFDKEHLVPFGEFVPLQNYLPFGKIVANVGNFAPGNSEQKPIVLKSAGGNLNLGPLICYEDIFSRSSVKLAKSGAQLLVNLTNDAWYGHSSAQRQHLAMAIMQVYQTGIPMVRVTNNGASSFIPYGGEEDIEPYTEQATLGSIAIDRKPRATFFAFTHPVMEWIWFILFFSSFFRVGSQNFSSSVSRKRIFFKK